MDLTNTAAAAAQAETERLAAEAEAYKKSCRAFAGTLLQQKFKEYLGVDLPSGEVLYLGAEDAGAYAIVDGNQLGLRIVSVEAADSSRNDLAGYMLKAIGDSVRTDRAYILVPAVKTASPSKEGFVVFAAMKKMAAVNSMPKLAEILSADSLEFTIDYKPYTYTTGGGLVAGEA